MSRYLHRRRLYAWIACLAILMSALAPSVSRTLAWLETDHVGAAHLHEQVQETEHVSASAGDHGMHDHASNHDNAPAAPGFHFEHCAYCFLHAGSFGLLPTPILIWNAPEFVPAWPLFDTVQIWSRIAWTLAQPRAPPSSPTALALI